MACAKWVGYIMSRTMPGLAGNTLLEVNQHMLIELTNIIIEHHHVVITFAPDFEINKLKNNK